MNRHLVFVYGTLKSGEPNHDKLQPPNNATLIGNGVTVDRFPMVIASKYNIPYVLDQTGHGNRIRGEIYEVDDACLAILDQLEEHPDYYERTVVQIEQLKPDQQEMTEDSNRTLVKCSMYILRDFHTKLLTLPMHGIYSSAGDHGLPYNLHEDRSPNEVYCSKSDVKKTAK